MYLYLWNAARVMSDYKLKVSYCFVRVCYFCTSIGETYKHILYELGLYTAIGDGYKHICKPMPHVWFIHIIIYENHCIIQWQI